MSISAPFAGLTSPTGLTIVPYSGITAVTPASSSTLTFTLPSSPLGIYLLAKYPSWNGKCINVVRASDSATLDIGFAANGYIDTAAASAFMGASTLSVATWYDQSGNGWDLTQATAANQMSFYPAQSINGIPSITNDYTGAGTGARISGKNVNTTSLPASVTNQSFTMAVAYLWGGGMATSNSISKAGGAPMWDESAGSSMCLLSFPALPSDPLTFTPRNSQPDCVMHGANASTYFFRNNGVEFTASPSALAAKPNMYLGKSDTVVASGQEYFGAVMYDRSLTTQERQSIEATFTTLFKTAIPNTKQCVFDGDSITAGFISGQKLLGFVRQSAPIMGTSWGFPNLAVPGQTLATCYTNRANMTTRYNGTKTKNICHIFAGTNDIAGQGIGTIVGFGTTLYTGTLIPYIQAAQAAGFTVIVGTMLPRNWLGTAPLPTNKETERLAYNALITNGTNIGTYGYTVVDYASLFPTPTDFSSGAPNAYSEDGVHPTILTYTNMATLCVAALSAA